MLFQHSLVSVTMICTLLVCVVGLLPLSSTVRIKLINCQQSEWHCANNAQNDIVYSCSNVKDDVSTNCLFMFTDKKLTPCKKTAILS